MGVVPASDDIQKFNLLYARERNLGPVRAVVSPREIADTAKLGGQ
jgi:hypothetical protein